LSEIVKREDGLAQIGGKSRQMYTSLDTTDKSKRMLIMKALQDCDAKLTENVNKSIMAVDYFAHDVQLKGKEDGEIIETIRLVVIDQEGLCYECVSQTLLRSLQTVAFVFGPPPWEPPLKLTVKSKRNGERNIYWFESE
jgi:hypothetical protein